MKIHGPAAEVAPAELGVEVRGVCGGTELDVATGHAYDEVFTATPR